MEDNNKKPELKIIDRLAKELGIPDELMKYPTFRKDFATLIVDIAFTPKSFINEAIPDTIPNKKRIASNMNLFIESYYKTDRTKTLGEDILDRCIQPSDDFIFEDLLCLIRNMPYLNHLKACELIESHNVPSHRTALHINPEDNSVYFMLLNYPDIPCADISRYTYTQYLIAPNNNLQKNSGSKFKDHKASNSQKTITRSYFDKTGHPVESLEYYYNNDDKHIKTFYVKSYTKKGAPAESWECYYDENGKHTKTIYKKGNTKKVWDYDNKGKPTEQIPPLDTFASTPSFPDSGTSR